MMFILDIDGLQLGDTTKLLPIIYIEGMLHWYVYIEGMLHWYVYIEGMLHWYVYN